MGADARFLSLLLPLLSRLLVLVFVRVFVLVKMKMKASLNSRKRWKSRRLYPPGQTLLRRGRWHGM